MYKSSTQIEARATLLKRGIRPLIDQGEHLDVVLHRLVENIEGQAEQMLAAIFFYDPNARELCVGAAPNLQPAYKAAVNGFKIGPQQPACGSAVFRRERVVCVDVRTDPLWTTLREYAEGAGFRAVWSQPIFASTGEVVGTLAFYFPEPKAPDSADFAILEIAAGLAAVAIEERRHQVKAAMAARASGSMRNGMRVAHQ